MPVKEVKKFGFDTSIRSFEHFTAGHDHHVDRAGRLMVTKQLAGQPLCPVALDRRPHLTGRGNAKTRRSSLALPREHGHEAAGPLKTCLVNEFEVGPLANMLGW
ncbi:MAG: hypothetical protein Q8L75_01850 [Acidobacteriota bacterium]|nr:hypothetical protein [Acidobacteriota bacterium]